MLFSHSFELWNGWESETGSGELGYLLPKRSPANMPFSNSCKPRWTCWLDRAGMRFIQGLTLDQWNSSFICIINLLVCYTRTEKFLATNYPNFYDHKFAGCVKWLCITVCISNKILQDSNYKILSLSVVENSNFSWFVGIVERKWMLQSESKYEMGKGESLFN